MKLYSKFILPLLCTNLMVSSCNYDVNDPIKIMYGSYIHKEALNLSYDSLFTKLEADKENMLLAVYPGEDSTCSCWLNFKVYIDEFLNAEKIIIYKVNVFDLIANNQKFNLPESTDSPSFVVIKDGEIKKTFRYSSSQDHNFFTNYDYFKSSLTSLIKRPSLYYVDDNILQNKISLREDVVVTYTWSSCQDCTYLLPNVIKPYVENNSLTKDLLIMDLEVEGILLTDGKKDRDGENYKNFLKTHFMSSESTSKFGYGRGFVPTSQYYHDGELTSASVFFNDTLVKENDIYKVKTSFYSSSRLSSLDYLSTYQGTKVLEGMALDKSSVVEYGEYLSWKQEEAAKYHAPLLNVFLNCYLK